MKLLIAFLFVLSSCISTSKYSVPYDSFFQEKNPNSFFNEKPKNSSFSDKQIRNFLISESIKNYPGNCPCPYFSDRAGRRCGARSAWSRPGGYSPLRYESDISDEIVKTYRKRLENKNL